jgi:hypothetical protein
MCPECKTPGKFTRYIDTETGKILREDVGRCDRENSCGYHYTPKQFFDGNPEEWRRIMQGGKAYAPSRSVLNPISTEVKYIDSINVQRSLERVEESSLWKFFIHHFGPEATTQVFKEYQVGVSGNWDIIDSSSTLFWQIDVAGQVRQCKRIRYDQDTGKRKKGEGDCFFLGKRMNGASGAFEQTFFGAHLLSRYPDKKVGIVESEKTALVLAIEHPQFLWLATGGAHGCKWTQEKVYGVLEGRVVVFFPDLGMLDEWKNKVAQIKLRSAKLRVSEEFEELATSEQIEAGLDLADVFINQKMYGST